MTDGNNTKKLWSILASLVLAVVVMIVLDTLPVADPLVAVDDGMSAADTAESGEADDSEGTSETVPDTETPETTAESAADTETEAESTAEETTAPVEEVDDGSVKISFLGACAPGSPLGTSAYGSLNAAAQEMGPDYFFSRLSDILATDDLTVAANACVFGEATGDADSLFCSAPTDSADIYKDGSIEFVSLAAPLHHFTDDTRRSTEQALRERGIRTGGAGEVSYLSFDEMTVALLSTALAKNAGTTADLAAIREAKSMADYVIVYFWGGEENSHTPEEWLTKVLHTYADAGASLLIGCGTGVLRPMEQYGDATIAYSLGSILDGSGLSSDNTTAILSLTLTPEKDGALTPTLSVIPCYTYEELWQPCVVTDEKEVSRVSAFLSGVSATPTMAQ